MKFIECALVTLAIAMTCGESTQAAPRLLIDCSTGEATIVGVTGELGAFFIGAKSLEAGASDILDNVGMPDLGDNDADDNDFSPPGSDGVADGEEYFRRNPSNLGRYVGFNALNRSGVPSGNNIGLDGFDETDFGTPVVQPLGYIGGSTRPFFTADLPHVLGIMFKPGNPNLTQVSATQNLFFKYTEPGFLHIPFDGQIVIGGPLSGCPEPCGLTLVAMGTLVALGACRRSTSKRTS